MIFSLVGVRLFVVAFCLHNLRLLAGLGRKGNRNIIRLRGTPPCDSFLLGSQCASRLLRTFRKPKQIAFGLVGQLVLDADLDGTE